MDQNNLHTHTETGIAAEAQSVRTTTGVTALLPSTRQHVRVSRNLGDDHYKRVPRVTDVARKNPKQAKSILNFLCVFYCGGYNQETGI